jgi:2-aminoadipate transaminase
MPRDVAWTSPTGGFLTWLALPDGLDARELRPAALEAGVAYVPGAPFYPGDDGHGELRLSFSALGEDALDEATARLASVLS